MFIAYEYYSDSQNNSKETESSAEMETSEYYEQGKEISSELISEMENIDWDETYDKAEEKGKEAAEFLNKLLGSEN